MYQMFYLYRDGDFTAESEEAMIRWLFRSVKGGFGPAMNAYATMLCYGLHGLEANPAKCLRS